MGIGRVCGTSASSAPTITTKSTSSWVACSRISAAKLDHRYDGSQPCSRIRSRLVPGTEARSIRVVGHTILDSPVAERTMRGREYW